MKNYILVIGLLSLLFNAHAQTGVGDLSKKFDYYQSVWPGTKIHLVFNQEKFSLGDTAYFKVYFLNQDLIGINDIQLIDLNLVDSKGEAKVHFMVKVINGVAQNQLAIPNDLAPGMYLISAHSSWMKNFSPLPAFKKQIEIVRNKGLLLTGKPVPTVMPEGGHLVRDVSNKVSIITHRPGSIVKIVDEVGQEVGSVITDSNGVGSITFKPAKDVSYFASLNEESAKISLPVVENDGISVLLVNSLEEENVRIKVASPNGSALRNEEIIIIAIERGRIVYSSSFVQASNEFVTVQIPRKNLSEGIVHVSFLNRSTELIASRDFYNAGGEPLVTKVAVVKNYFHTRERVTAEVSIVDSKGQPVTGEFSVSVVNDGLFSNAKRNTLQDELNILSDVNGRISIDRADPNWFKSVDDFLISFTQRVPWKEIMAKDIQKPRYTFTSTIQKKGRAFYASTGQPLPDRSKVLFYLQKDMLHYETFTLNKGQVQLTVPDIYGQDEFLYLAEEQYFEKEIPDVKIEWDDEAIDLPHAPASAESDQPDTYGSFISKRMLMDRSYGFFTSSKVETTGAATVAKVTDFEIEVVEADITIKVQDYNPFPNMVDLVKEIIPSLRRRTKDKRDVVLVSLSQPMRMPTTDPLYIIDGIATRNTGFFLSIKPSEVLTVKVINSPKKLQPLGILGKTGIVIVETKSGEARESLTDRSRLIEGLNKTIDFRPVNYARSNDLRKPDFRSTIYWNPSVRTDSNGKSTIEFYCSDDIGTLTIRVDGIAAGRSFSAVKIIEVQEVVKN
ncbi:hypothetical protein BH09BAC3_BH09BAC3_13850 [soil metagenome]